MSEPWSSDSPFSRIVAIRDTPFVSGLADPQKPNHKTSDNELNRFYPKDGTEWEENKHLGRAADSFIDKLPGKYSGEMRAVVQDHLSRGLTPPYDYGFSKTHGVFTASNDDKYVIEITSSGIRAWPLGSSEVTETTFKLDSLSYIPHLSPDPDDDTVIAVEVSGLSAAYGYAPFFSECGWAFSSTGHKASNVVYEDRNETDNPATGGLTYSYSYLYEITIIEEDNKPFSASISLLESDWLYGDRVSHFKFPSYGNNSLVSFDWFRGHFSPPWSPSSDAGLTAPIHSWYDGNTLRVVRFRNSGGVSTQPYIDNPIVPTPNATTNPGPVNTTPWGDLTYTTGIYNCFSSPLYGYYSGSAQSGTKNQWTKAYEPQWMQFGNAEYFIGGVYVVAKEVSDDINILDESLIEDVIITMNDRESVGHYRKTQRTETIVGHSVTDAMWWYDGTGEIRTPGEGGSNIASKNTVFSKCEGAEFVGSMDDDNYGTRDPSDSSSFTDANWSGSAAENNNVWADGATNCDTVSDSVSTTGGLICELGSDPLGTVYTFVSATPYVPWFPHSSGRYYWDVNYTWVDIPTSTSGSGTFFFAALQVAHYVDMAPVYIDARSYNEASSTVVIPTTGAESVALYADSSTINLPAVDSETEAEWSYYIDDLSTQYQLFLTAVDMSGTVAPLHMKHPVSSRSSWSFDSQIVVPAPYPNPSKTLPSWVGNP